MSLQNKLRDSNAKRRASGGIRGRLRGLRGEVLEAADGGELLGVHGVQHRRYALRRPFAAPGRRYHCRTVPQTRTERATTFDLHEPILICCFELTAVVFCSVLFCVLQFVDDKVQWMHIDIAGTVWSNKKRAGTGFGVTTLVEWVLSNSSSWTNTLNNSNPLRSFHCSVGNCEPKPLHATAIE